MNFTVWLFKRAFSHVNQEWDWLASYREFIFKEVVFGIILTSLFGILWFIVAGIITGFIFDGQVPHYLLWVLLLTPVMFYFYNLLKVYHAIYTAEKIKCWERLKE